MRKNRKQRRTLFLLILLLAVTIGFALLSTTLKINGTASIKSSTWDIHWENVVPNQQSTVTAETPTIGENRTKVTYEVELELPGDFYEFTVDAKNDGSINGMIDKVRHSVKEVTIVDNEEVETTATLPSYILYTLYYDGTETAPAEGDILEAGEKQTYRVRIEYDSNSEVLPETNKVYRITDEIDYVQTKDRKNVPTVKPSGATPILGCGTIGDEVCIGTECFNMITCDNNKAVLLAKYNLLVGNTCTSSNSCTAIPTNTEGYGKQSSTALGQGSYPNEYPSNGTIAFSNTSYWFGKVGPEGSGKKYKGTVSYSNADIEEYVLTDMPYVVDEDSYLYQHIVNYDQILKDLGAPSTIKTRLLTFNEAYTYFNCDGGNCLGGDYYDDKHMFLLNTSFWTGTSPESDTHEAYSGVMAIDRGCAYGSYAIDNTFSLGIRPVVEIPMSTLAYDGWRFTNPTETTPAAQKWEYWKNGKKIISGVENLIAAADGSGTTKHYYAFHDGYMYVGWYQDKQGNKYYFSSFDNDGNGYVEGLRFENTTKTIDGVSYTFDANGVCTQNCEQAQNVLVEE